VEMVRIPEGGFYAGDGDNADGQVQFGPAASPEPGAIANEEELNFQNVAGTAAGLNEWYYNTDTAGDDDASGSTFQVGEPFPKGFRAFYIMKYEISQGQYRDFLNMLTREQQKSRVAADISADSIANYYVMSNGTTVASRQGIRAPASGNGTTDPVVFGCDLNNNGVFDESGDGEWIAMNYLSWMDLAAYADWAALRPMTEFEYEKVARGPLSAVSGEYPWGSTDLTGATSITNSGQADETAGQTGSGLCNYNDAVGVAGPLRVGFAATASTTTRLAAGAGFYGVLDLAGNVWERSVTLGNAAGRGFGGTHGDGVLSSVSSYEGYATNVDWPGIDSTSSARGITGAAGSGFRGGAWNSTTAAYLKTSGRSFAGDTDDTRRNDSGGRLVRAAPT
jgi:formylglycine-generating enzyme required for sulfatase activity